MAKWIEVLKDYNLQTRKGQMVSFKEGQTVYVPDGQADSLIADGAARETEKPSHGDRSHHSFKDE